MVFELRGVAGNNKNEYQLMHGNRISGKDESLGNRPMDMNNKKTMLQLEITLKKEKIDVG